MRGAGVTPHAWNDGCSGGRRRGEEPVCSGVRAVMTQSGGERGALTLGGEFVFSFHVSHLSVRLFVRFSSIPPPFFLFMALFQPKGSPRSAANEQKKKVFFDLFSGGFFRRGHGSGFMDTVFNVFLLLHVCYKLKGSRQGEKRE